MLGIVFAFSLVLCDSIMHRELGAVVHLTQNSQHFARREQSDAPCHTAAEPGVGRLYGCETTMVGIVRFMSTLCVSEPNSARPSVLVVRVPSTSTPELLV